MARAGHHLDCRVRRDSYLDAVARSLGLESPEQVLHSLFLDSALRRSPGCIGRQALRDKLAAGCFDR